MSKRNKNDKNKPRGQSFNKKQLANGIMAMISAEPGKTWNYKIIASRLNVKDDETRRLINLVLDELTEEGQLDMVARGKFKSKSRTGYITGRVELTIAGYGFVVTDEFEDDIFVSQNNLHQALHGDTVKVYVYARRKRKQPEGEVIEILERAKTTFVGTVEITDRFAFLSPSDRLMPYDLFIPLDKLNGAKNGQKAIARLTEWLPKMKNPNGEIIDVLGNPGEHNVEMHAILAEFDLPYKFPEEVELAAAKISDKITKKDIDARRDMRTITTFTIDPADAKDFDDALSIQKLPSGLWEIGVHIADVSHYVQPGSLLDEDALSRGTSVYLVDRVVPMLPERLSNNICSLRPHEDKLTYSAVFEIDDEARVQNAWFGRTIINSDRRFGYEEAQEVIDSGQGDLADELSLLNRLAQILRRERFANGAVTFEKEEVKFVLDEQGKPQSVYFKQFGTANQLIEEFMLLANRSVAERIGRPARGKKAPTFVYRVHDKPNPDKLASFSKLVHSFGYKITTASDSRLSQALNDLLEQIKGKNEQNLIETLAVRSMAKAIYSTRNIGHYGLAFKHYTHFTSPIRRYPDIMAHRLLDHYLAGGESADLDEQEAMCRQSSEMERRAVEAERASVKYKQVEFMIDKVGKPFEGIISGVTEWGIFVEIIENKCEGLVSMRELNRDDFYDLDEDNYCLIGRHSNKRYQLGDKVIVEVLRANLPKKQLDFALVEDDKAPATGRNEPFARNYGREFSRPKKTSRKKSRR